MGFERQAGMEAATERIVQLLVAHLPFLLWVFGVPREPVQANTGNYESLRSPSG